MDPILAMRLHRRVDELTKIANEVLGQSDTKMARLFVKWARHLALEGKHAWSTAGRDPELAVLTKSPVAAHSTVDAEFVSDDAIDAHARAYLKTISDADLLAQLSRFARVLPPTFLSVLVASGTATGSGGEGVARVQSRLSLSSEDLGPLVECSGIVAMSRELLSRGGPATFRMFEDELRRAVLGCINDALVAELIDSDTTQISPTGDPVVDLRAGLAAAEVSDAYVVAAGPAVMTGLALSEANRAATLRGGDFIPGVATVRVESLDDGMLVIPASRFALIDSQFELLTASHASLEMDSEPTNASAPSGQVAESTTVSLFQTNSVAVRAIRRYSILKQAPTVLVAGS